MVIIIIKMPLTSKTSSYFGQIHVKFAFLTFRLPQAIISNVNLMSRTIWLQLVFKQDFVIFYWKNYFLKLICEKKC